MLTRRSVLTSVVFVGVVLTGCSSPAPGPAPTEQQVVQFMSDYPSYDQSSLFKAADLIVEGSPVKFEYAFVEPRYEGGTPEENPLLGLSEAEIKAIIDQDRGVPCTFVTFRVTTAHKGDVSPGQEVVIIETGGEIDGVAYEPVGATPMAAGHNYLVFAAHSFDGEYATLGPAGVYQEIEPNKFQALDKTIAPFEQLTSPQAARRAAN